MSAQGPRMATTTDRVAAMAAELVEMLEDTLAGASVGQAVRVLADKDMNLAASPEVVDEHYLRCIEKHAAVSLAAVTLTLSRGIPVLVAPDSRGWTVARKGVSS